MSAWTTVLVGTGGSESSSRAVDRASTRAEGVLRDAADRVPCDVLVVHTTGRGGA